MGEVNLYCKFILTKLHFHSRIFGDINGSSKDPNNLNVSLIYCY